MTGLWESPRIQGQFSSKKGLAREGLVPFFHIYKLFIKKILDYEKKN